MFVLYALLDFNTNFFSEFMYLLPEIFFVSSLLYMLYFLMGSSGNVLLTRKAVLSTLLQLQRSIAAVVFIYTYQLLYLIGYSEIYLCSYALVITPSVLLFKILIGVSVFLLLLNFRTSVMLKF